MGLHLEDWNRYWFCIVIVTGLESIILSEEEGPLGAEVAM